MPTTYTNSLGYITAQQAWDAETAGYVDTVLRGASFLSLLPIVPTSHFMRDEYFEKTQSGTKLTQQRKLNEEPDAKSKNRFAKVTELTTIYTAKTDIDYRLAEYRPEMYDQMLLADAEDLMQDIDYDVINGVPTQAGYGMNGLANRISIGSSYDTNNGGTLSINTSASTFKTFLRRFRQAVRKLKLSPGMTPVAFMNESVELAIQSGRDELGANVVGTGTFDIMNQRVTHIENVPCVIVRKDSVGTDILPFSENSESSTSIWIVGIGGAPGEGSKKIPNGAVLVSGDQVINRYTERIGTQFRTFQEMDVQLRVPPGSVSRLSRLLVA